LIKNIFNSFTKYSAEKHALKITLIYFIIGCLWILLSDKLVELLIPDKATATIISILKGWVYVFVTALLIYSLSLASLKKFIDAKDKLENLNMELEYKVMDRTNQLEYINIELKKANGLLEKEIIERQNAEIEIYKLNDNLENKVIERTGQIQKINTLLEEEISERKKAEETLQNRDEKFRLIFENANDCIFFIDLEGNILEANNVATKLYGYTYKEFLKMKIFELRHSCDEKVAVEQMKQANENGVFFETVHLKKDGTAINVDVSSKGISIGNSQGLLSIVRDVTARKKADEKIEFLSFHDTLTGLYNRRFYEKAIQRLDNEKYFPLTLVMADVNGLKLTNDAFGHQAGDEILKVIAHIIKRECRAEDVVVRIGGDEFVILLPETDAVNANKIIDRINQSISNEKVCNIILSISTGFAVKENKFDNLNEVFIRAEDTMYRCKLSESSSMRRKTIDLIMNTLYEKSNREMLHSKRVSEICVDIATNMDFAKDEINQIRIAGLMHDIGKIGIEAKILDKPEKLNDEEWNEIKRHSEIGYRILSSVNEFSEIADYVLEHHERWDGKGYPKGLKGEEIAIRARIIAIADAYDAMTSSRVYRETLSDEQAVEEIKKYSGVQFDPKIVEIFVEKVLCRK